MPRLSAALITLNEVEQAELQQLLKRKKTPQQIALRAKIIVLAAQGKSHGEIAETLEISKDMSRLWRNRWLELKDRQLPAIERLMDAVRPGAPATFTLEQITQLYAIACAPPEQYGRPISQWTSRELAAELIKQGIVASISQRHVGRLLAEAELKPHQSSYWLHPPPTQNWGTKLNTSVVSTNKHPNVR
ncbi:helix-turn-helix domain-containing protein [Chamaesiphon minutus]|uniref:helix-turn-helix domain-containing protein n=1 Tax=Chamaesiphon minutus TaxID=1173032 RepID=UPI00059F15EC|nr:helix-turn-helix domain-containing protein [Chamaesiphon minutus]